MCECHSAEINTFNVMHYISCISSFLQTFRRTCWMRFYGDRYQIISTTNFQIVSLDFEPFLHAFYAFLNGCPSRKGPDKSAPINQHHKGQHGAIVEVTGEPASLRHSAIVKGLLNLLGLSFPETWPVSWPCLLTYFLLNVPFYSLYISCCHFFCCVIWFLSLRHVGSYAEPEIKSPNPLD